jgi:hypothetical protein
VEVVDWVDIVFSVPDCDWPGLKVGTRPEFGIATGYWDYSVPADENHRWATASPGSAEMLVQLLLITQVHHMRLKSSHLNPANDQVRQLFSALFSTCLEPNLGMNRVDAN